MALIVRRPGPLTLIQDLGRPGWAALGVGRSGAMDRGAARRANALVGNAAQAAVAEILLGPVELLAECSTTVAVTGASGRMAVDGKPVPLDSAVEVVAGAVVRIGPAVTGLRFYLAVRGGLDLPRELGSRSRDTLADLGPAPVVAGDRWPIGLETGGHREEFTPPAASALTVRFGPRDDWFTPAARELLVGSDWQVSTRADRTGIRLVGPTLERTDDRELPSEPMIPGCIQVSPDGVPTVLMADAPVTGGYPVIAVVDQAGLDILAQSRPGSTVRWQTADRPL